MSAASNYLELKVLDHVLRYSAAPFTAPTTLYVALFTNTSGNAATNLEAGTLTDEVVVTSPTTLYARQPITFNAATGTNPASSASAATVSFPTAGAAFGTITHVAIVDGATRGAGNVLFWGAVTTPKTIDTGDTFSISSGNLTVSLA
jgi:2-keto-4-pentenoate hydratase